MGKEHALLCLNFALLLSKNAQQETFPQDVLFLFFFFFFHFSVSEGTQNRTVLCTNGKETAQNISIFLTFSLRCKVKLEGKNLLQAFLYYMYHALSSRMYVFVYPLPVCLQYGYAMHKHTVLEYANRFLLMCKHGYVCHVWGHS